MVGERFDEDDRAFGLDRGVIGVPMCLSVQRPVTEWMSDVKSLILQAFHLTPSRLAVHKVSLHKLDSIWADQTQWITYIHPECIPYMIVREDPRYALNSVSFHHAVVSKGTWCADVYG